MNQPKTTKMADDILIIIDEYGFSLDEILDDIHKKCIESAFESFGANKARTAHFLGLNRTTLVERMRKLGFGLNPPNNKSKEIHDRHRTHD